MKNKKIIFLIVVSLFVASLGMLIFVIIKSQEYREQRDLLSPDVSVPISSPVIVSLPIASEDENIFILVLPSIGQVETRTLEFSYSSDSELKQIPIRPTSIELENENFTLTVSMGLGEDAGVFNDLIYPKKVETESFGELTRIEKDKNTSKYNGSYIYSNELQFIGCPEGSTYCGVKEVVLPTGERFGYNLHLKIQCDANTGYEKECDALVKALKYY